MSCIISIHPAKTINISVGYGFNPAGEKMGVVCNIDVIKEGKDFVIRVRLPDGTIREYRNPILEDVLTEMINDVQEELSE